MKKLLMVFACGLLLFTSSCNQDDTIIPVQSSLPDKDIVQAKAGPCVAGFQVTDGFPTNTGGNCGISLTASPTTNYNCNSSSCGTNVTLTSGQLYRVSSSLSTLTTGAFSVTNNGSNYLYVRVVGYISSSSSQLVVSCKRLDPLSGNGTVAICNKATLTSLGITKIHYEVYAGSGSSSFIWTLNK